MSEPEIHCPTKQTKLVKCGTSSLYIVFLFNLSTCQATTRASHSQIWSATWFAAWTKKVDLMKYNRDMKPKNILVRLVRLQNNELKSKSSSNHHSYQKFSSIIYIPINRNENNDMN